MKLYALSGILILLLSGCGSSSSQEKQVDKKEGATVESKTSLIRVLGISQEWQKDPVEKSWIEAKGYCENLSLEGKNDWRLPTSKEFFALLDTNKSIDENFPKVSNIKEFWSSTETSFDPDKAWKISAWSSSESYTDKTNLLGVRCIRGESLPQHSFTQNANSLKDSNPIGRELLWQDDKDSSSILVDFNSALSYCEAKSQRLPTVFELQNMIDKETLSSSFQHVNKSDFTPYWSNTQQPTNSDQSLTLNFVTGGVSFSDKGAKNFVRCVEDVNHAPTVTAMQSVTVDEDSQVSITLTGEDVDQDALNITITKTPDNGTYINNIYTPNANYHGNDTIKYIVSDGVLESKEATVSITVYSVNDAPVAESIDISTLEDTQKDFILSVSDADNDTITFLIDTMPSHGVLTYEGEQFSYTPNVDFSGTDSFIYRAFDDVEYSQSHTVNITVTGTNDAPIANSQNLSTDEDSGLSITLSGSDKDGDTFTYHLLSNPTHGTVSGTAPNLIYTPFTNYFGSDSFTFKINDSQLDSNIATIDITILGQNDAPIADSFSTSTDEDIAKDITLLVTDSDDSAFTYTITNNPTNGTLTGTAPNLTYTPDANYNGSDSFSYKVNDGTEDSNVATVTIDIGATNDAPIAAALTLSTDEDTSLALTLLGSDPEGSSLTYQIVLNPLYGTIIGSGSSRTYQPNANYHGADSFSYRVNDGQLDSEVAVVNITINSINDTPVADSFSTSTDEDIAKDITLLVTDPDDSAFTYTITNNPTNGTLTGTAPNLTYTPDTNYNGSDSFSYKVNDGTEDSNVATITIAVNGQNDAPTADYQDITINEDQSKTIILTGSDNDINDTLSYAIIKQPSYGSLSGNDNNYSYTPQTNYHGSDYFSFKTYDGTAYSQDKNITITINSINDIPTVISKTKAIEEDTAVTINLEASDDDNDTLTFHITNPLHGSLSGTAPNLTYTPESNYYGVDTFTFYVSDGESNSSQATVDINISSVNDAPVADAGADITADEGTNITLDGSNSNDIDGTISGYLWREGITELSSSVSFSQVFSVGTHDITLQVTDNDGLISTDTITVTINSSSQSSFISHTVANHGNTSEWFEMVDLDNDGDLDILSASSGGTEKEIAWYKNHGDNTFSEAVITADTADTKSIKAVDMDNDGDIDILYTTHEQNASLMQCINDGDENFTCNPISNATDSLASIEIVDQDGDGKLDIITASCDNNRVEWLKNSGDSSFTGPYMVDYENTNLAISVHKADFNKDGKSDIVAAYNSSNRIDWYAYDTAGNGNFVHHFVADITDVKSIEISDINNDGYDDIIAVSNTDNKVYWYKSTQTTNPTFDTAITVASLLNVYYASAVDMDNDGDMDILTNSSESGGKIAWYENTGSETNFPEHIVASGVDNVIRVFAADIDNDGNMDVVAGDSAGNVIVYENSATDVITLLPKTGDANDGAKGAGASFTRDITTEIVTDNISGLMWSNDSSATDSVTYWSTVDNTCKNMTTGSYSDWRIPTLHELYYLLDRSQSGSKIDSTFTNIATDDGYWAYEYVSMNTYSWIDFNSARSNTVSIGSFPEKHIRCVRGESFQTSLIRDDNKKVVLDHQHNLMWDDTTASSTLTNSWTDADNVCTSLNTAGYSDWRVPNINELYSIATISGVDLSFNYVFENNQNASYWSSTKDDVNNIYTLNFGGTLDDNLIDESTNTLYVRCVRNIQ